MQTPNSSPNGQSSREMNQIQFSKNVSSTANAKLHNTILWIALITPFLSCGEIDFPSLKKLAISQSAAGNGIVLLGSTGEGLGLTSRSGVSIPIETLQAVQNHQNCWALKEASGDLTQVLAYRQYCPDIALYSGEDAMIPYLAQAGVRGLVSVCSNAWPMATQRYVALSLAGETQGLFPLWQNAVDELFRVASPIPVKKLMHQKQMIATPFLRAPLTHLELDENNSLLASDKLINQWLGNLSK
jgi:dihydrodipicolinate synthase/N-acetylneuraminate lyase